MATTRRRRIRAHREQELRTHEVHRRRDATAHAEPLPNSNETVLRALTWAAIVMFLVAVFLLLLLG
jgi:hypothetical protein